MSEGRRLTGMPRYYFQLRDPGAPLGDEDGVTLPDAEAAWYQAVRNARELIGGDGCASAWADKHLDIMDDRGLRVDTIPLQEIARYTLWAA